MTPAPRRRVNATAAAASTDGRSRRRPRRDDEVLAAAVRVFYERGYSDSTVQDIADAVGILKGSIYHYIDTKEDLLFRLLEGVHNDVGKILEDVGADPDLAPLERLELYVRRQVSYNLDNIERISVYYHDIDRLSPERLAPIIAQRHEHERFVTNMIKDAQTEGTADPSLDARLLRNCVFATVIWTYRWYRPGGRASRETIADVCCAFALRGVVGNATGR
jgi:AcrR family transcriptional regulator